MYLGNTSDTIYKVSRYQIKIKYLENFSVVSGGDEIGSIAGFATNFKSPFSSLKDVIRAFPKVRPNAKSRETRRGSGR